jgi:hypothetical protein
MMLLTFTMIDGRQLPIQNDFRAFLRAHHPFSHPHPGVDLGADDRIDGVNGERDVADLEALQVVHMGHDLETVGGDAEEGFRKASTNA